MLHKFLSPSVPVQNLLGRAAAVVNEPDSLPDFSKNSACSPPGAEKRLQNSGVTGPKLTKILSAEEGSSAVLTRTSCCDLTIRGGMPAYIIKVSLRFFCRLAPKIS